MEDFRGNIRTFLAFFGPTFGWVLLFFFVPLGIIWVYSFGENVSLTEIETTWTLSNYARIGQPEIISLFWRSLWLAGLSTAICLAIGYPAALVIATAEPRWKPWLLLIIILPFWTNLLIRTYALLNILGTRGRVNDVLGGLWDGAGGVLSVVGLDIGPFQPVQFLGTQMGVIIGLVYVHLPFTVLPIY
ncbi:MAG: ABC transporter permease, partial [Pseudomonadota bacterium]